MAMVASPPCRLTATCLGSLLH